MTQRQAGVRAAAKQALSLAAVAGLAGLITPAAASAADADAAEVSTEVSGVEIVSTRDQQPESPKYVAPILDTPQTITVVPRQVIEAQNLMSLRDVLSTLPGITFGAGEGGGGYGDSINLRGYSANNDIMVDGVRDSAQYTRSDPFNLEQIEVVNGASSVYSGAGSIGGSINMVSKRPIARDVTTVSVGGGTDDYLRGALDANHVFGDSTAVRLNLMGHRNDVPGRDVERYERWGVAPSVTFGMMSPTQVTLSYFHQEDDNTPQYGVPYASNSIVNGPLPGANPARYFGYRNIDTQQSDVDMFTVTVDHRFGDGFSLRNLSRYQQVDQLTIVNPPQGTFCLASGVNPQTGAACTPAFPEGSFLPSGPRGNLRDTNNELLYNQTDLSGQFELGGLKHSLALGVSFAKEEYDFDGGNVQRNADGTTPAFPVTSLSNPDSLYAGPVNFIRSTRSHGERENQAVYLFDAIELNPHFEINGGLRYEHNQGTFRTDAYSAAGVVTPGATAPNEDNLFSYRLGLVFKPTANASLYVAYGDSQNPSQQTVNGGCTVAAGPTGNCNVDPEEAENIEIGAKWNTMDGRLLLTAALFRNERSQYRVDDPTGQQQSLDGRSRVDGVALGVSGQVTPKLYVYANYTWLDSEFLQNASNSVVAAGADFRAGDPLPNTPEHSFNLWATYDLTRQLQIGYGLTYAGEYAYQRSGSAGPPAVIGPLLYSPDYVVHSLAVTYRINERVDLRLNVRNLTDEEYYTRVRSAGSTAVGGFGWATPGEARNATLTLNYRF